MGSPEQRLSGIWRTTSILIVCAGTLVACSKEKAEVPSGQVVARVGNEDVTTQELQNEFRLANVPSDKQKDPAIVKGVLKQLVLRKYLLQQALAAKLDREPGVLLDILRSREQILATAYLNRTVSGKTISQSDIDKYIADNPLKFANRQLVSVEQITFPIGPNAQAVVDASKDLKTLDAIDQKLTSMNVPHNRSVGSLNSAEIPESMFNTMQAKKAEDVFFIRSGQNGVFFKVTGEQPRPLEGEAASNMARQLIRADNVNAELGEASVAANLEAKYQGEYAAIMADDQGKK